MLIAVCISAIVLFLMFLMAWKLVNALIRLVGASLAVFAFGAALWLYGEELLVAVLPWIGS